ncbi:YqaA family protein [Kangiella sp. HZ709]|uniref:YqaA family protein n=1 Tax=Kangiella sp. HZ709 TaxID=2666328 RepID=UPI0012B0397D|nr:YqaA family protein [Kangiella sp. HZ709]MRX28374.1 DedA family protein [Kangiella sp. HZ709]
MKLFTSLYDKCLKWARHKYAVYILGFVSFIESIFFPIPTAIMFAPMALAKPNNALKLALITTIFSVLGGIAAYFLGFYAFDSLVTPLIEQFSWQDKIVKAEGWFETYGIWIVVIAGFSPIPYKILTLTAGAMQMAFVPFVIASIVGRAAQFFLIAGFAKWGGESMEQNLRKYMEVIGWSVLMLAIVAYVAYQLFN